MANPLDLTDLNPEYHRRLNTFLADAAAQGIPAHIISGYRNNDLQTKLYANYQAKQAERPLPYPEEGSGGIAASPGGSYHNFGFAADVLANDPNRQNDLINLANSDPKYGIHALGGADPPHFQIAGSLQDARAQYGDGAGGGGSGPHPMVGGGASGGGDATAAQLASDMMRTYGLTREQAIGAVGVMGYESGNFRVMQEANPQQGGRGGLGYAQWTGPRRTDFENYAQQNNLDPSSYEANWGMIQHEIATNPQYAKAIDALKQENTVEGAARSWETNYEGMTPGGPGVPAFEQHIARAVDYNNRLPQDLSTVASRAGAAAPTAAAAAAPYYAPPSPQAIMGQSIGQALSGMSGGFSSTASGNMEDPPDQPAIRSMAAETDFTAPPASAVPAQYAGGIGGAGIGSQLGALAAQPNPSMLENPQTAPSITAGAPSMTSMLGELGTTATPGLFDNRGGNQLTPNPNRRTMRLA